MIAAAEGSPVESATKTILVVDDDPGVVETLARLLTFEGFKVATALDAEQGLTLADSVRPNAILLDLRMPITGGLQFLRMVRSKPHLVRVPVAIVTGDYWFAETIAQELITLRAAVRFKPLETDELIALAKTLVA